MRPIDGVVLDNGRIELRGGTIIPWENSYRIGTAVVVSWNFTANKAHSVELKRHVYPGMSLRETCEDEDWSEDSHCVREEHDIVDELCRFDCVS